MRSILVHTPYWKALLPPHFTGTKRTTFCACVKKNQLPYLRKNEEFNLPVKTSVQGPSIDIFLRHSLEPEGNNLSEFFLVSYTLDIPDV